MRINIFNNELFYMGFDRQDWKEVIIKATMTNSVKHVHVFLNGSKMVQKTYLNLMGTLARYNSSKGYNLSFTIYTMGTVSKSYLKSILRKDIKYSIDESMSYTKYMNCCTYFSVERTSVVGEVRAIYYKPYKLIDDENIDHVICWSRVE